MFLLISFAFFAGIVTVLSPCILPVLPIVLSGSLTGGKKRPLGIITGFIVSFTFFTLFSFTIVKTFGFSSEILRTVAVVVLALFGISLFIPQFQVLMEALTSKLTSKGSNPTQEQGFRGGVIIGLSLGLFWTPCVGPILASVITLAATSTVTFEAILITLAYSLGTAIPMFFIVYGGRQLLHKIPWVTRNTGKIQKVFGVIMVLLALALHFNLDRSFQTFILDKFPQYGTGLTKFEENETIQKELDRLRNIQSSEEGISQKNMEKTPSENFPLAPNPEFAGGGTWLNSEPLTLNELKGKVVLIDFWTYSCINCIRTMPYVTSWYEKYKDQGFVVIGVHTPEFEFEKNTENVRKAMKDYGITYPVVQDNDYGIWKSYKNRYWPAEYFIDKNGRIRRTHFGEGKYEESEEFIRMLLAETGVSLNENNMPLAEDASLYSKTPESYLGYDRLERFASPERIQKDKVAKYSTPSEIALDTLGYSGNWNIGAERATPESDASLQLHFQAKEVYLVLRSAQKGARVQVALDGKIVDAENAGEDVKNGIVSIDEDRLYRLIRLDKSEEHVLGLTFLDEGIEVYAFTFG